MAIIDGQLDQQPGRGQSKESGVATYKELYEAVVDDMTELRAQFVALCAKLDADAGVTDVDYESTLTPAALTLQKSS